MRSREISLVVMSGQGGEEGYERRNEQIERVETRDSKSGKRPLGWDDLELFHLRPGNTATGVDKQQYP